MSPVHDYIISNASGAAVRSDLNNALSAIVSNNSSATEPATTYAYQMWADTGSTPAVMKLRDSTNSSWITLYNLDGSSLPIASATEIVFNDAGADLDFRIEGDNEANLFYVDAGNDRIGIGTASPDVNLTIKDVSAGGTGGAIRLLNADATTGSKASLLFTTTTNETFDSARIDAERAASGTNLIFSSNEAERVRIDSSGRLGVGETSPLNRLHIKNTSANDGIRIVSGTTAEGFVLFGDTDDTNIGGIVYAHTDDALEFNVNNSERARIDSGGNVLIDTSFKRTGFFNTSSTYGGNLMVEAANNNADRAITFVYGDDSSGDPMVILGKHRSTSTGIATSSLSSVVDTDGLGIISFQGKTGDRFCEGARIASAVDGTPGSNDLPAYLRFLTNAGGSSPVERMRIEPDGNVAIGTGGAGAADSKLYVKNTYASGYAARFFNDGDQANRYGILVQAGDDAGSGTSTLVQFRDGNGTSIGAITFTGGTVSYGAFTAHHPCKLPEADKVQGYAYGTLLETTSIEPLTNSEDEAYEQGIIYNVRKTQAANSRAVLGAYGASMEDVPDAPDNWHKVYVLGDGHILCNNSGGDIAVGDGICSSAVAGIGQKATVSPSMIIGIAQEAVTFANDTEEKLVAVQYGVQQFIPWSD